MTEAIDQAALLAAVRSIMMPADGPVNGAAPNTINVNSVEIEDGFLQLVFHWDRYPDLLGMRFAVPDTTDHPAWTTWAPQSIHEWATYAVWLQVLENMQTGFLYWGRRRFDGQVVWLESQDDGRNPRWGAKLVPVGACTAALERAGLSPEAGLRTGAAGERSLWVNIVVPGSEEVLGQVVVSVDSGSAAGEIRWVELKRDLPQRDLVMEKLLHFACTAAAERGILRLAASGGQAFGPDLLAFGFTDNGHGVGIATCHSQRGGNTSD